MNRENTTVARTSFMSRLTLSALSLFFVFGGITQSQISYADTQVMPLKTVKIADSASTWGDVNATLAQYKNAIREVMYAQWDVAGTISGRKAALKQVQDITLQANDFFKTVTNPELRNGNDSTIVWINGTESSLTRATQRIEQEQLLPP